MEYTLITMKDGTEIEVIDRYTTIQDKIYRTELSSSPKFIDVRMGVNEKVFINVTEIQHIIGNA